MSQLTLDESLHRRDVALCRVSRNAGHAFAEEARQFVLDYLQRQGDSSGEAITDACRRAGIVPHDDRAFGPVYLGLSRRGLIVKRGDCPRIKGHGAGGGIIWGIV